MSNTTYEQLDAWIDAHFDEQTRFLQALIQVPTDTPPGNNTPHALRAAELIEAMGIPVERHEVPQAEVEAAGFVLESASNLLANPADPHTANVFDGSVRGHTDTFILKFRKPGA